MSRWLVLFFHTEKKKKEKRGKEEIEIKKFDILNLKINKK